MGWLYAKGTTHQKVFYLIQDFEDWYHRAYYWRNNLPKGKFFSDDWRQGMVDLMLEFKELLKTAMGIYSHWFRHTLLGEEIVRKIDKWINHYYWMK